MKVPVQFVKTTLVGGVLFLVPITALVMILGKAIGLAHKVVGPLAARLPEDSVIGATVLAVLLLVVFSFLAGLFSRTSLARKIVQALEEALLSKLPGYDFIKGMSQDVLGAGGTELYPVVIARFDDGWQIALQVDVLEDGRVSVFVPDVPNPRAGSLHIMTADRVEPAGATLAATVNCLRHFGVGTRGLIHGRTALA